MGNIINRLSVFKKKFIVHPIADGEQIQEFKFYTPRVQSLISGRTRELLEPLAQAVMTLMSGAKQTEHVLYDQQGKPAEASRIAHDAETLKLRNTQKQNAISQAMGSLLNPLALDAIVELLADSLRDDFSKASEQNYKAEVAAFKDGLTVDLLAQFLQGYFKALVPLMDGQGNSIRSGLRGWLQRLLGAEVGASEAPAPAAVEPATLEPASM